MYANECHFHTLRSINESNPLNWTRTRTAQVAVRIWLLLSDVVLELLEKLLLHTFISAEVGVLVFFFESNIIFQDPRNYIDSDRGSRRIFLQNVLFQISKDCWIDYFTYYRLHVRTYTYYKLQLIELNFRSSFFIWCNFCSKIYLFTFGLLKSIRRDPRSLSHRCSF